jgi:hypothetical protein
MPTVQTQEQMDLIREQIDQALKGLQGQPMTAEQLKSAVQGKMSDIMEKLPVKEHSVNCRMMAWSDIEPHWWPRMWKRIGAMFFSNREIHIDDLRWYHVLFGFRIRTRSCVKVAFSDIEFVRQIPETDWADDDRAWERHAEIIQIMNERMEQQISAVLETPYNRMVTDLEIQPIQPVERINIQLRVDS